ncbi:PfkB family carbohydrate kinase, partial [Escherichia coli]|uniref:PfkB family carbohydrate kinase n=1 Tax=Escherichia coli TaxID=562 RepID=UPI00384AD523
MIRVACVGITVMDRIYYVEGLPTESGKYVARNYTEVGGGPAATAAVAAARLGAQVDFIGRVGDDDTGNSLLAELESWGVNTRYTKRYNHWPLSPLDAAHEGLGVDARCGRQLNKKSEDEAG